MVLHYDKVLDSAQEVVREIIANDKSAKTYIFRNVYGKLLVYVDESDEWTVNQLRDRLKERIGSWLVDCDGIENNPLIKAEIESHKKKCDCKDRVCVIERFLSNVYWSESESGYLRKKLNSKLICFYSYKGGVGRTTTMVLSAMDIARRGKKVVLVDFDLEAPGIASLFPDDMSHYGLLDFFIESKVYGDAIQMDEYLYSVGDYCDVTQSGGEMYVIPAYGKNALNDSDLYRKELMRFNMDMPVYLDEHTPIDDLLEKIDSFIRPDYIFIDTRSGLHQIGGITLTRYSDMAVLLFYGSMQNAEGMKVVIPVLKRNNVPFLLVNSKMPANEEVAKVEKKTFLEGSYIAMSMCDEEYEKEVLIDDPSGEHYPKDILHSDLLEVVDDINQLKRAYEEQKKVYREIGNILEDVLQEERPHKLGVQNDEQEGIVRAFSGIMSGLETGAAEDEFANEEHLFKLFYPLKGYSFIFDMRKFLVLGPKGVGKTALFCALKNNKYAKSLAQYLGVKSDQYESASWYDGILDDIYTRTISDTLKTDAEMRYFWLYNLISVLKSQEPVVEEILKLEGTAHLFSEENNGHYLETITTDLLYSLNRALEAIDRAFGKSNKVIIIIYDALDRFIQREKRGEMISILIDIWYEMERILQNIKSKIFLRKDIFDREVSITDKVKLKNYSVTLKWDYDQLFSMVWKRAINDEVVKRFYNTVAQRTWEDGGDLGTIPLLGEEENRLLLSELIGTTMGGTKKASTYNWFRNRLGDTKGEIVPRSILDVFSKAADREIELRKKGSLSNSIIRPKCFEDSLEEVSSNRVTDLREEYKEYDNFFDGLADEVQRSPVDEEMIAGALKKAGFENPKEEINNLKNIGIIRIYQRKGSDPVRYHFPDIYLRGLGLQRAGMK